MLVEEQQFGHSEAIVASEDFVLADTPYNIRRAWDEKNQPSHPRFSGYECPVNALQLDAMV